MLLNEYVDVLVNSKRYEIMTETVSITDIDIDNKSSNDRCKELLGDFNKRLKKYISKFPKIALEQIKYNLDNCSLREDKGFEDPGLDELKKNIQVTNVEFSEYKGNAIFEFVIKTGSVNGKNIIDVEMICSATYDSNNKISLKNKDTSGSGFYEDCHVDFYTK